MFEKYTTKARNVIGFARQEALRLNHDYIGTEHLLLGLLYLGIIDRNHTDVLMGFRATPQEVKDQVEKLIIRGPDRPILGSIPFTPRSKRVLEVAYHEAEKRNQKVGIAYLLLALTKEEDSLAWQALKACGITHQELLKEPPQVPENASELAYMEKGITVDPEDLAEEEAKPQERRPSQETVSRLAFLASEMITKELEAIGYHRDAEQKHQLYQSLMQTLGFSLRAGPIL